MTHTSLKETAQALVTPGKGILAADESTGTAGKRLANIDLDNTERNRQRYRNLFLSTENLGEHLSGVILFEETLSQQDEEGRPFPERLREEGIIPGVKVDRGRSELPGFTGEVFTEGIDGLRSRLDNYRTFEPGFTKFRSVIRIGPDIPSEQCLQANARIQALYAGISQEKNLVPVVEPEVLLKGDHDIDRAERVTTRTLNLLFDELLSFRIDLEGLLLKTSMVLPGPDCPKQESPASIAEHTIRCLRNAVPESVPGIVFLSGGQSPIQATENLNEIVRHGKNDAPWELSFSFGRALQQPALETWAGSPENIDTARSQFLKRLRETGAARRGEYKPSTDTTGGNEQ